VNSELLSLRRFTKSTGDRFGICILVGILGKVGYFQFNIESSINCDGPILLEEGSRVKHCGNAGN